MNRIIALLLLPALAGCQAGPDYRRPEIELPAAYHHAPADAAGPAAVPSAEWWSEFRDPLLTTLIADAMGGNLDIVQARARLREARAMSDAAGSSFWPSANATGSVSHYRQSAEQIAGLSQVIGGGEERNLYQGGFDATWELDLFGGVRRGIEAADARTAAADASLHDMQLSIAAEVARNYYELRLAQSRLDVARATIATEIQILDIATARFQAGLTSELDVAQANSQLALSKSWIPLHQNTATQAMHRLAVLTGREPGALLADLDTAVPLPDTPPLPPVGLPSELLRRRPDIRVAERNLAAATAEIGVATADLFPRFSLTGQFGRQSEDSEALRLGTSQYWSFGPSMRWSIFTAGRVRATIRARNAAQEAAAALYVHTVWMALENTENALVGEAREGERHAALETAVLANLRALELAQSLYQQGIVDYNRVLDAERLRYQAEDMAIQSRAARLQYRIALYKALGGGWEAPLPDDFAPEE